MMRDSVFDLADFRANAHFQSHNLFCCTQRPLLWSFTPRAGHAWKFPQATPESMEGPLHNQDLARVVA